MRTIDAVRRSGISVEPGKTIRDTAAIMERAGVGALAIVEGDRLVGIVTDRDLVRRGLARGLPLDARVDGVMSSPVVKIEDEADQHDAFGAFRTHGFRRLAVVRDDVFVGMITIDDLIVDIAADLADLARPITAEVLFGHRDAAVPSLA
jgi:CBS domain-containing protein